MRFDLGRQGRKRTACILQLIGRKNTRAAPIGKDGQPFARQARPARQNFRSREHVGQRFHAQHAGPAEGRVIGGIRSGQRARVRHGGLGAGLVASALDHDDRLYAGRAPRRGNELRRIRKRFHVDEDGTAFHVAGEVVEQIAEIHIRHVAQRHDMRKADIPPRRPIDDRGQQRARLRKEGDRPLGRIAMRKAGVEADLRQHQTDAVGTQDAQAGRARSIQHTLPGLALDAGRDDDGGADAFCTGLRHHVRHRPCRRRDDDQIRHERQFSDALVAFLSCDFLVLGIDEDDLALETARHKIAHDTLAHRPGLRACPNQYG